MLFWTGIPSISWSFLLYFYSRKPYGYKWTSQENFIIAMWVENSKWIPLTIILFKKLRTLCVLWSWVRIFETRMKTFVLWCWSHDYITWLILYYRTIGILSQTRCILWGSPLTFDFSSISAPLDWLLIFCFLK